MRPGSTADPFGERPTRLERRRAYLLGASFEFESSSPALLRLVDEAFAGLPRHRLPARSPPFRIRLQLANGGRRAAKTEPPAPRYQGGAGLLSAVMDADNFAVLCPAERSALVAISNAAPWCRSRAPHSGARHAWCGTNCSSSPSMRSRTAA